VPEAQSAKRPLGLTLIAVGKWVKVCVLIAVGVVALAMFERTPSGILFEWADGLRIDPNSRYLHRAVTAVSGVTPRRLEEISFGTFVYAALFAVEGLGLWFQKHWAEYFTLAITGSFIPLEIYELVEKPNPAKGVTLVLNLAAMVYLLVRVAHRKKGGAGASTAEPSDGRAQARVAREPTAS
jgi:uncharacterized membrane protein (DUF2068 family)